MPPRPCGAGLLRVAKLVAQLGDQLALIRNANAPASAAMIPDWCVEGDFATVELRSNGTGRAFIRWSDAGLIDVRFDDPDAGAEAAPCRIDLARAARVAVAADAKLCLDAAFHTVRIEDISLGGMRVLFDATDCIGAHIFVTPEDFETIAGTVRWQEDGKAGIAFDAALTPDALGLWLASRP